MHNLKVLRGIKWITVLDFHPKKMYNILSQFRSRKDLRKIRHFFL